MASPIPRVPPVISTVLPVTSTKSSIALSFSRGVSATKLSGRVDDEHGVVEPCAALEAGVVERLEQRVEHARVDVRGAERARRHGDHVPLSSPAAVDVEAGPLLQLADEAGPVGSEVDQPAPHPEDVDPAQRGEA